VNPNLNSLENNFLFSCQTQKVDVTGLSLLLPRSAQGNQVAYLKVLFKVKKRLDRIDTISIHGKK
jgi:hypothetical protein